MASPKAIPTYPGVLGKVPREDWDFLKSSRAWPYLKAQLASTAESMLHDRAGLIAAPSVWRFCHITFAQRMRERTAEAIFPCGGGGKSAIVPVLAVRQAPNPLDLQSVPVFVAIMLEIGFDPFLRKQSLLHSGHDVEVLAKPLTRVCRNLFESA